MPFRLVLYIKAERIERKFKTAYKKGKLQQYVQSLENALRNKERIKQLMH